MMKRASRIAAGLLLAAAANVAQAQDVAEGQWINLFDGETTFGWTAFGDIQWSVAEGELKGESGNGGWLAHNAVFQDFELTAKIKVDGPGSVGLVVRGGFDGHHTENGAGMVHIDAPERKGEWHEVTVRALGSDVTATLDGNAVEGFSASAVRGHIGIQYHRYHGTRGVGPKVYVSEVKLRPLQLTPIFNGTDLSGWNIIPDRASKFSVVDGALNILDGNGQIETDAVWKNFTLQMDIISNGEHLNSGVFFRGPKGVFWKGYESQVRNQWVKTTGRVPWTLARAAFTACRKRARLFPPITNGSARPSSPTTTTSRCGSTAIRSATSLTRARCTRNGTVRTVMFPTLAPSTCRATTPRPTCRSRASTSRATTSKLV